MKQFKLSASDYEETSGLFRVEKERLYKMLSEKNIEDKVTIEHIGSTAIPGLDGKGIIDVLVICEDEQTKLLVRDILFNIGYTQGELNKKPDGRLFFYKYKATSENIQKGDIHLHLVLKGDKQNLISLELKNHLLAHPEDVDYYNRKKKEIANVSQSRVEYMNKKSEVMDELMRRMRQ